MKIAIVKLSAIGDIVHTMIILQIIKNHLPNVRIDWIVESSFKEVLTNNPDINNIYCVNLKNAKRKKSIKLLIQEFIKIRKIGKYDIVIDLQGLIKSALIAKLIPSKITAGFDKNSIRERLASIFYNKTVRINYAENIIKRNIFLVTNILQIQNSINISHKKPFLFATTQKFNLAITKKNIIIILGASFPSKIYSIEKYSEIIQNIDANFILVWGNISELKMAEKLQQLQNQVNISEKLSFNNLKSLISQSDLVIGGDTGPVHMAWGLGVPSIVLFGSTPANRNTYQDNINIAISADVDININKIDKTSGVINKIEPQEIILKIKQLCQL